MTKKEAREILAALVHDDTLDEIDERYVETGEPLDEIADDLGLDDRAIPALRTLYPERCS